MTFSPLIIWAKANFFFEQLFPVVARTWLGLKSGSFFFGPKFWFLAKKSDFCHTTPIFVDDPFLALVMTVNFPPWERFFDFPFRSYSCFCKKNLVDLFWISKIWPFGHEIQFSPKKNRERPKIMDNFSDLLTLEVAGGQTGDIGSTCVKTFN